MSIDLYTGGEEAPLPPLPPQQIDLTEDEWEARFKPLSYPNGDSCRQYDWTNPADLKAIQEAEDEGRLWTLVDGDEGIPGIIQGYHYVNRLAYYITELPVPPGLFVNVRGEDDGSHVDEPTPTGAES